VISFLRPPGSKRVLVHEILSIQVLSAAVIGVLAIAGLYWGGQWVLKDNYSRWALQWTDELNELGSPLYLSDDAEAMLRLESFVDRYPEIDRVAFFSRDGHALFSVDREDDAEPVEDLPHGVLRDASDLVGDSTAYLLNAGTIDPRRFDILAPVWTESIAEDALFSYEYTEDATAASQELVGFIAIHLDFSIFHNRFLANVKTAVLILLSLLTAFALYGRYALQKALSSISDLEAPIQALADGNLKARFEPARHKEISNIVEALQSTASALDERDNKLLELANKDSLTGLCNRRRFLELLQQDLDQVMEGDHTSALLFIDLDQFKYINDACGHPAGDRLIRKVGDELERSVDVNATVARFGGDEFMILLRRTNRERAHYYADAILENMRRMAHVEDGQVFHVHCSIGVALAIGPDLHKDELIGQADVACREAKSAGRNRMHFYKSSAQTEQHVLADVGWMNRLREAIDNDEFLMMFQPINRIDTGETTHHEVLIRLRTDDGKLVSPDAFLPSAVRFGLMAEIDFWMIRNAAAAYAKHAKKHDNLKFAINLSANAFENEDLTDFIEESFREREVQPSNVVFEITESLAIRRPLHVEQQISTLRELGFKFALDDFGTGYSSFSYLQKLHFDFIKIDGAFVADLLDNPVDQKLIKLIAEIGREVGMQTIAEYVQSAEALAMLGDLGVDMAQGYFVGRPTKRPHSKSTPISLESRRRQQTSA
jgi:diguanylate cyclase (GGDEF)-like protein